MQIEKAAFAFVLNGMPVASQALGHGHINSTWKITTSAGAEYVLQKINTYVFKDPHSLMANISAVTEHLRRKVSDPRMALCYLPSQDGQYYHRDEQGEYWRMYEFGPGFCLDLPESEEDFYQSALAFGRFQDMLADFPAHTLVETIPEFHNTVDRYRQLKESVQADACGRVQEVQEDLAYLFGLEEQMSRLQKMRLNGQLPLRVTHNDTKLNNVLLDPVTRKSLCVLDLDTVMPGLSAHDYGDAIRFGAATAAEDEQDLEKMNLDLQMFEAFTRGFLEAAPALTDLEVEVLPLGALTITVELATRFLKDHLDGDCYFKIAYPGHNLVRARSQIKLAKDMQKHWDEMNRIVAEIAAQVRK